MMSPEQNVPPGADPSVGLALYYYPACPYCVMVLRVLEQMGLNIELCNIMADSDRRLELIEEGGRSTVPCLRIEHQGAVVEWLYESYDIIDYLQEQ